MPKTIVFNGRDVYVRGTRSGRVEFRYPEDRVWFTLDGGGVRLPRSLDGHRLARLGAGVGLCRALDGHPRARPSRADQAMSTHDELRARIHLVIPGVAPSKGNSYRIVYRKGRPTLMKAGGGRYHDGRTVDAFEAAALRAMLEAKARPMPGFLTVEAVVYPPDLRADVPGVEKVLLDSLQSWRQRGRQRVPNPFGAGCYDDDRQVRRFVADFGGVDATSPRVEVIVTPWTPRSGALAFVSPAVVGP